MSRIRAGNTLLNNQYAPPFNVDRNVASGWLLRWNETLRAFEAYDPDALKKDSGFDKIEAYQETATGTTTGFIVPWQVASKESLIITINGVKQNQDAYSVMAPIGNQTTVILSEMPLAGDVVEFLGLQASDPSDIVVFQTTGDTGPSWTLPWVAPNKPSLFVTINGIKQQTTAYDISYNTSVNGAVTTILSFNGSLQTTDEIEVVGILDTNEIPPSPLDGVNLGGAQTFGLFKDVDVAGVRQVARFKSLAAGNNITIAENVNEEFYTIDAIVPTFTNTGSGQGIVSLTSDPIAFRTLAGDGDQISVTLDNGTLRINYAGNATTLAGQPPTSYASTIETTAGTTGENLVFKSSAVNDGTLVLKGIQGGTGITVADTGSTLVIASTLQTGYVSVPGTTYTATVDDAIIGCRNVSLTTITLPDPVTVPVGHRVIVKDEVGGSRGSAPIVVQSTDNSILFDGNTTTDISVNRGFVEVYSDGTNYNILGRRG